ncbi:lipopolysaccharide biosynthesis protein [Thauera mechernichensis]|uniref:Lipopolysaccharide biosynthesis protein n=1 Tax=Thauera mechernichensis TaxID=82788 RepID=A0ABW3WDA9_9RHOO|nr:MULTISPECIES: lipopolysaccharide biosynthesis protein [Thauera]ENO82561.1 polysaccharide biosynthesis protein [Thauera sp. 27]MDG3065899.1 lipopolysaccharide biosynthesis protein [Thauera mechernichensis]WBL65242.1 lipopolysaccharide biosynthesis protein [Thauera sp. WB-2]HAG74680.1 lipopolysaccharide biosynthesis protein [Thauera sp.]HAY09520.1 lipopolysaccharide biosynthesis protein [Thauera sp.]
MSAANSIRAGIKWLITGSLGTQILQFAFGIALARLLVPEDFGFIVTIQIFTGFVGLLSGGGMGQALVQSKDASARDFDVVFTAQLAVGALIFIAFYFAAPWFATTFGNPLYTDLVRVSAISFLLRPFVNTRASALHREMRFKERSLIGLVVGVLTGLASIWLAIVGAGPWSLILSGILGSLITLVLLDRVSDRRPQLSVDMAVARRLGAYGIKVSLNDLASYFTKQASNAIISRVSGPSAVGLFNKGESLAWLPFSTVSGAVYEAVFRAMAKAQDRPDEVRYLFYRMIMLMVVYTLPIYIGLAWMAEPFMHFVYGEKWLPSADPLRIVSLAGLLICIGHPCGAVLAAMNRLGREVWIHASQGLLVAAACYYGLQAWGLVGAAWGIFAGIAYSTPVMYYLATRCFQSSFAHLVNALAPGLKLNLLFLGMLAVGHAILPTGWRDTQPALYMLIVGGSAGLAYAAAFLFIPLNALADESLRWRRTLRLAR